MSSNGAYKKLKFCLVGMVALSRIETQILLQGWRLTQVFSLYEGGGGGEFRDLQYLGFGFICRVIVDFQNYARLVNIL